MSMRDSPDHLLNLDDLAELEELLNVFIYEKSQDLFIDGGIDNFGSKEADKQIKQEIWDFLKGEYFYKSQED